ncbi:MAG: hypothetical protein RML37_04275 [Chitinophagales bacterium]|nr:hypothetical protein [Chitinophagales bacterium]
MKRGKKALVSSQLLLVFFFFLFLVFRVYFVGFLGIIARSNKKVIHNLIFTFNLSTVKALGLLLPFFYFLPKTPTDKPFMAG